MGGLLILQDILSHAICVCTLGAKRKLDQLQLFITTNWMLSLSLCTTILTTVYTLLRNAERCYTIVQNEEQIKVSLA